MYLNKQKRIAEDGSIDYYLSVKEKYHDPKKGSRERTVEGIGLLSVLKCSMEDPIAYYSEYAKRLTEEKQKQKDQPVVIDMDEKLQPGTNDVRNVGYGILKELYRALELDKFWLWKTRGRKMEFSTDQIFRLLVFSRAMFPGSKRETWIRSDRFFEPFDGISLDDVYNALDIIAENQEELQEWIYEHSRKIVERDLSASYFDCTNYYFDIGSPDLDDLDENGNPVSVKYRKRGPEKNHRPDPIIEMGLLMDANGIPIAYDLFPGNESEKVHMRPIISRVRKQFEDTRIIFVADRGLNTSDNIYWLNGDNRGKDNDKDGYVYGQSVRGADAEFKKWVLSGNYRKDTVLDHDGKEIPFIHKSRIYPKKIEVSVTKAGSRKPSKKTVTIDQKQMVYYSAKYARRQKAEREVMIARAKDLIRYPKKYDRITSKGCSGYILNLAFDKDTGAVVDGQALILDEEKIREEEKYDGYYSIVTSELKLSDQKIRDIYRGLSKIEDSFKVTKTYFKSRPVYVWLNEHIDAHFSTCFLALVLIRMLEQKLGNKYTVGQILESLKNYTCVQIDVNRWQFTYYDEILESCSALFDMNLDRKYRQRQEIKRLLHYK